MSNLKRKITNIIALYVQTNWTCALSINNEKHKSNCNKCSGSLLAVGGHVCENSEKEVSLQARVKGCGYDDVTPLWQFDASEYGPRVDVVAPTDLLLGDMHAVGPV